MKSKLVSILCLIILVGISPFDHDQLIAPAKAQIFTEPKQPNPTTKPRAKPKSKTQPSSRPEPKLSQKNSTYNDPVTFCSANPNSDQPTSNYVGQLEPQWVRSTVNAMMARSNRPSQSSPINWRCMNGRVIACSSSSGPLECMKPKQERLPNAAMQKFCFEQPNAQLPKTLIGQIGGSWVCRQGNPINTEAQTGLDARGFSKSQWVDITDYAPSNKVGTIPRIFVGKWNVQPKGKGLIKFKYNINIDIHGGEYGYKIGSIIYYQTNTSDPNSPLCETDLYVSGDNAISFNLEERFTYKTANIACPVQGPLFMESRDGQLWLEWRKKKNDKVTLSGWAQRK